MATHSSILAWRIPWTEGPGQATVHRVTKSWILLKQFAHMQLTLTVRGRHRTREDFLRLRKNRNYPVKGRKARKSDLGREKDGFRGLEKSIRLEELSESPY